MKTDIGIEHIQKDKFERIYGVDINFSYLQTVIQTDDVIDWCKTEINSANAVITRNGKNWYVNVDNCIITVNAYSYTIITAHKE